MVASALQGLESVNEDAYPMMALLLALMSGSMLLAMGFLRLGFLMNFLSHPVISGFTSAAALVIGLSQVRHLLGINLPRSPSVIETVQSVIGASDLVNPTAAILGFGSVAFLIAWRSGFTRLAANGGSPGGTLDAIAKSGPLVAVIVTTLLVTAMDLKNIASVKVVGAIPAGLPGLTTPEFTALPWQDLALAAFLISFVGFLESVSVAKALGSKRRQKVDANQELIGLGAANIASAFSGGYPVTGGFSRSVVNFTAGAVTPLASLVTAALIALTVLFLTPLFYYLPKATLAAIILVAVATLVDFGAARAAWRYNKADALSLAGTFAAVLAFGVEQGIILGAAISIGLYLWRTSRPHMAVVGRVGTTEHFRNILRHDVQTCPHVRAVRVDESLYFANANFLEGAVLHLIADHPEVKHVVLICSAVNFIDASALETLERLTSELRDAGVLLHLTEVKGPVMDKLEGTAFMSELKPGKVYLSTHEAMTDLECV
ncbi:MAG: STAS domain-containing protein [Rhodospirillales bacterium]|nr:STAS domain-containing protein [Rhodospirillales bacterium]